MPLDRGVPPFPLRPPDGLFCGVCRGVHRAVSPIHARPYWPTTGAKVGVKECYRERYSGALVQASIEPKRSDSPLVLAGPADQSFFVVDVYAAVFARGDRTALSELAHGLVYAHPRGAHKGCELGLG